MILFVEVEVVLEFDGATKRFGRLAALDECSFTAQPGRLTGLLGPNGAGKTTAMRAALGLGELDGGAVRWHGSPVTRADPTRFGHTPGERGLYTRMRVRDQLVYLGERCGQSGMSQRFLDIRYRGTQAQYGLRPEHLGEQRVHRNAGRSEKVGRA